MARKTVKVEYIKDKINHLLTIDTIPQDAKKQLCLFLDMVLLETDNYKGFQSLTWINGGYEQWVKDGEPDFPEKNKYLAPEWNRRYS
ncbi:MAG: hypothetical protein JSV62_12860 [Promethearchaeota archaeon]|nr:MAG: hypothetical protein JSV62_12860 [Candidatus Lokiarchaeota archaeon]